MMAEDKRNPRAPNMWLKLALLALAASLAIWVAGLRRR